MDKKNEINIGQKIFAIALLIVGFSGIILPILPGLPFVFWGLFILGGIGLIDRIILRWLPKNWRKGIMHWLERFERKR